MYLPNSSGLIMNLNDAQKKQVTKWIADGARLSDIQNRLSSEFGLTLTYMEARLLVDDLKLVPKDTTPLPPPTEKLTLGAQPKPGPTPPVPAATPFEEELEPEEPVPQPGGGGNVTVKVDALARPGSLVSGSVKFGDGQSATWYLDQMGRLGMAPQQQGYRPSPGDLQAFQRALESELAKLGL